MNFDKNFLVSTIQKKIIITTLLVQILLSVLISSFLYINSRHLLVDKMIQESINMTHPLIAETQEKLEFIKQRENKQEYLDILLNIRGKLVFTAIKDVIKNVEEIYYYTDRSNIKTLNHERLIISPALKSSLSKKEPSYSFQDRFIYINIPIHYDGKPLGGLLLEYNPASINTEKRKAMAVSVIFAFAMFMISLFLINIFSFKITNPLQDLIRDLQLISESGEISDKSEYPSFEKSEFEPLIHSYLNMKKSINEQIAQLNTEIKNRKKIEQKLKQSQSLLAENVEKKDHTLDEIKLMVKEEISRKNMLESALKVNVSILDSLLDAVDCGILILNDDGEVVKSNKSFSENWELPESVVLNDTESQLLNYFAYQIVKKESFMEKYKKCAKKKYTLGQYELKDGRSTYIVYTPILNEKNLDGKILTFYFQDNKTDNK